ncbi:MULTISPECIES: TetR/AcrR family transcriptional regulator [Nocardiaceae]|uniref:TetR/AcrR family transcriptional regulator n=1 Tax=Nocardiaceae TaxID=85025 RepID=UPI000B9A77AB|nr:MULTISPECIES: TetR family transcriptional regulator C-terminal domain-containing protein [Rhodococcus]MDP9635350.1 AcrR family transcriptional regulator [Rhodococcus cercidiphylli]MBY4013216.1 TetR family transcriptional regulator C-terminal domain-containing protein [Rhodococcus fascians]MBY4024354.1 TetR family transcriptional regulator C-terminal domain-containing protein [Rhodococcus fascians]MDJ0408959.1 TetR family transcriptional regulator C-terminal domain-containing protein [Rhodoco
MATTDARSKDNGKRSMTQEERSSNARSALIDATLSILVNEGFRNATFTRIQQEAGVSRGLIGYHFGTKSTLMESVIHAVQDRYHADTERLIGDDVTGIDALRNVLSSYLGRLAVNPLPAQAMLVLATESISEAPEIRRSVRESFAVMRSEFGELLARGQRDGTIRDSVDPVGYAVVLEGVLRGAALQFLVDPQDVDLDAARTAVLGLVDGIAA